jgi:hypothetical protein
LKSTGLKDLKAGVRISRMIKEAGAIGLLEMQTQSQASIKQRHENVDWLWEGCRINWTWMRRRLVESSIKIHGREISAQSSSQVDSRISRRNRHSHHANIRVWTQPVRGKYALRLGF